jgi:hypothetical protein
MYLLQEEKRTGEAATSVPGERNFASSAEKWEPAK